LQRLREPSGSGSGSQPASLLDYVIQRSET